jgi:hypothetical protein
MLETKIHTQTIVLHAIIGRTVQGVGEQIKRFGGGDEYSGGGGDRLVNMVSLCRFGGVNTRAVVGVGWCTWSPSALSVWRGEYSGDGGGRLVHMVSLCRFGPEHNLA